MKNDTSAQNTALENADAVISQNLEDIFRAEASVCERKFAHLCERANIIARIIKAQFGGGDIMDAVAHLDAASEIYADTKGRGPEFSRLFADVNLDVSACLSGYSDITDRLYLCKSIAAFDGKTYDENDAVNWLSEDERELPPVSKDKKISFVRGNQSGRAFEAFARFVPGVLAEYEEDFKSACESVASGESTYAIIPVENSMDGRLNSFYKQIEKYSLSIVMTCEIDSDDGENTTTFALVYKDLLFRESDTEPVYECKITFGELDMLADIADAAAYYGAELYSLEALPVLFSGRMNTFSIVFGLKNANIKGLFCYLALEYPQTAAIGIYRRLA